jgi:hypothetical protein
VIDAVERMLRGTGRLMDGREGLPVGRRPVG